MEFTFYPYGVWALYFLTLGLCGILIKKPFFISARWFISVLLIIFIPIILKFPFMDFPFAKIFSSSKGEFWSLELMLWSMLAIGIISVVFLLFSLPDYIGYGIVDSSFREGLKNSLDRLEIPFEENLGGMYLSSIGANLRVKFFLWMGTARIDIRPRKFNSVLRNLVKEMSSYYQTVNVPVNFTVFYFFLICGAIMMILGGYVYIRLVALGVANTPTLNS